MTFLKIALLNMIKHGKRTLLILFAVMISVAVMEFIEGMLKGVRDGFFQNMVQESGHVQLHGSGWEERLKQYSIDYVIEDPKQVLDEIEQKDLLRNAEAILNFGALLIHKEKNLAMVGTGLTADSVFYRKARIGISKGEFLPEKSSILLSESIANLLDLSFGDPLIVLVEDSQGSPYYVEYSIDGLFNTNSRDFDNNHFFIRHSAAQELLYLPNKTTEIRINLTDPNKSDQFAKSLSPLLQEKSLEAATWQEIHGGYIILFDFFDIFMIFIDVLVVVVAATVITNAILMNMFERIEEFGTMRAIGLKKRQLFGLIMAEGSLQGVLGSILGLALGIPLVLYFEQHGLDFGEFTESFGLGGAITFSFTLGGAVRSFIAGILIAVTGSLYAAWVSVRKKIIESLSFA